MLTVWLILLSPAVKNPNLCYQQVSQWMSEIITAIIQKHTDTHFTLKAFKYKHTIFQCFRAGWTQRLTSFYSSFVKTVLNHLDILGWQNIALCILYQHTIITKVTPKPTHCVELCCSINHVMVLSGQMLIHYDSIKCE